MFLDFAGTLVNLDHVAQVLPYTPGAGVRLTVILSNGNAVHVKDGEDAVKLYRHFQKQIGRGSACSSGTHRWIEDAAGRVIPGTMERRDSEPPKKGKAK